MTLALALILVPAFILGVIYRLCGDFQRHYIREILIFVAVFACIVLFVLGLYFLLPAIFHS